VSEPFTETGKLRNVTRHIPRSVLIRVIRRDNSTCQVCGKHLLDPEIQIDHIIPLTKGGPSIESNLRVICSDCNLKKSNFVKFD
jgi:5-methylcytosine-specific restriction endonuclease McrA